jgi:hypothetical protein
MANNEARIKITAEDASAGAFASVTKRFEALNGLSVGKIVGSLAGLVSASEAAAIAVEKFKHSIELLDQLDKLSEKTGISVENLSALRFAGELAATPMEALGAGLGRLAKTMAAAAGGNKEAAATFEALGIEVVDATGKLRGGDEVFAEIAQRFAGYEDSAAKAALAQRLFGKSGAELIPLLNAGAAGLASTADEAKKLGAIYDKEVSRAAVELNDNLTRLKLASEGTAIAISGPLVKALADFTGEVVRAKKEGDTWELWAKGLQAASWLNPASALVNVIRFFTDSGDAAAKSTKQIQSYVNALGGLSAGGGRGFVNPKVAAPVVVDEGATGPAKDPLADAKRYLEALQKQLEKLEGLTLEEQALREIQLKRLGEVTPELEKQILATARLVDLHKAQEENDKASTQAAKDAATAAGKITEEADKLRRSVATPFEHLQDTLTDIQRIAENNPLVDTETLARLNVKAWNEYVDAVVAATSKTEEIDNFTKRAGENIQDYLGSGLFDILEGNFSNIGKSFTTMINRMVAEAAAANISRYLFGDLVKGGTGTGAAGGLLEQFTRTLGLGGAPALTTGDFARLDRGQVPATGGGLLSGLGSWFSSLLSFDVGTDYVPHDMIARIHQGEAIVPASQNSGRAGGAVRGGIVINQSFAPGTNSQTIGQAGAEMARVLATAQRRFM